MTSAATKNCIWVLAKYATAREQGFETRTVAIAREWVRAGRSVVVLSSSANHFSQSGSLQDREDFWFDGVHMVVLRTVAYRATASVRRVLSWLHFEWALLRAHLDDLPSPDAIIVTSLSLFSVLNGIRLSRKFDCPWVFEVRDIWPLTLTEEGGVSRWHPLTLVMAWLERMGYRRANLTVGTMPNLTPHASQVAGQAIPAACVPFGFDPQLAPPLDVSPARVELTLPKDDSTLTVGYAGSMGTANALDHLVDAAIALRDDRRFRFVLLGDGDLRASYAARTADCPRVHWLGKVPRDDVHAVLRQCDLLYFAAHPSRVWDSGMSLNKLTDYLLSAKPIIGSYSGFPSILNEAGCGEFLPAGDADAIIDALTRYAAMPKADREAMGQAGREWLFVNRTWGHLARLYLALLDGLQARAVSRRR